MRPADPGQLRSAWVSSGRFDQLRAETSSVGSKIGTRFASVLTTEVPVKPWVCDDSSFWNPHLHWSLEDEKPARNFFGINQNGAYALWTINNCPSPNCTLSELRGGSSTDINTGLNQSNLLAVVAKGSIIDLYVNQKKITSVSESTYSQGQIGVAAKDENGSTTQVVFSDAKVWT